jgi:hypothetical protein
MISDFFQRRLCAGIAIRKTNRKNEKERIGARIMKERGASAQAFKAFVACNKGGVRDG